MHRVLHDAATTVIEELRNATKETVQVAVLDGREVVYVERLESPHTLRIFGRVGHRNWAHCTSTGKVLLAHLPSGAWPRCWRGGGPSARPTPPSASPAQLRAELDRVRAQGWAENIGESELGVASVAAPVRNARGEVIAAVSVAGPAMRVNGDTLRRFFRASVIQAADAISDQLGWRSRSARAEGPRRPRPRGCPWRTLPRPCTGPGATGSRSRP